MKYPELVDNVKRAAQHGGKEFGAGNALAEFAVLLGSLAEDADSQTAVASDTADKNLKIANRAYWVSLIALLIAVLQFFNAPSLAARLFGNKIPSDASATPPPNIIQKATQSTLLQPTALPTATPNRKLQQVSPAQNVRTSST